MLRPSQLWLIRHAPVDGPRGIIHDIDAPADLSATIDRLAQAVDEARALIAALLRQG